MATDNAEFLRDQQRAIEQMRQMRQKSTIPAPPFVQTPSPVSVPKSPPKSQQKNDWLSQLPERLKREPDLALIAGLLLLLWSENADRKLLMALLYILF